MQAWEEKYYEREEGREEGERNKLKKLIEIKLEKGKKIEVIAEEVEESVDTVRSLIGELKKQES